MKKKYKNLLTIIIPRHIERTNSILDELAKLDLKVSTLDTNTKIKKNIDILIIDSYGKTKSIYNICKNIFLGGSLIAHGGQNPLEATRFKKHSTWTNIENFKEIYDYLGEFKLSSKVNNHLQLSSKLNYLFIKKNKSTKIQKKLTKIGDKILINTYNEIYNFIKYKN